MLPLRHVPVLRRPASCVLTGRCRRTSTPSRSLSPASPASPAFAAANADTIESLDLTVETTEAGPPGWRPDKEPCPEGMTLRERTELLRDSVAVNPDSSASRRFSVRRTESGLEFFTAQMTQVVNGEVEYHGYPTRYVPRIILRQFRDQGKISHSEYRRLVKRLG